jgi:hypothetical protein
MRNRLRGMWRDQPVAVVLMVMTLIFAATAPQG